MSPHLPLFKKTCPCTYFQPHFFNFSDSCPSGEGNQNLPPPFKKGSGGGKGVPNELDIYICSGHNWFATHRVLKCHRSKMSVIHMLSWKTMFPSGYRHNRTSCAQVHELPQSHCGDNRDGTLFFIHQRITSLLQFPYMKHRKKLQF